MTQRKYHDLKVKIEEAPLGKLLVSAKSAAAGGAQTEVRFPFDDKTLSDHLHGIERALLRSGRAGRRVMTTEQKAVERFGRRLFDAVFSGSVLKVFHQTRKKARGQQCGVRLKLCIDSPKLASLPWEFLFDKNGGDYVCLSPDTPINRHISLRQEIKPIKVDSPLRILAVASNPKDLGSLDVAREKQHMDEAIRSLGPLAELVWLQDATWRDLQAAMLEGPWHVFHFIGHGDFDSIRDEGLIYFEDEKGYSAPLSATNVARLLRGHSTLQLAVLNSCEGARGSDLDIFSSPATALIRGGIPAVVGMQYEITDTSAKEFSRSFYEFLVKTGAVDVAVNEARRAITFAFDQTFEWATPVLYSRSTDGQLFDVSDRSKAKQSDEAKYKTKSAPARQSESAPTATEFNPTSTLLPPSNSKNVEISITITEERARTGGLESMQITRKRECHECSTSVSPDSNCRTCRGSGLMDESKTVKVKIPAGVKDGSNLRYQNGGNVVTSGGRPGDLLLHVHVATKGSVVPPPVAMRTPVLSVTEPQPSNAEMESDVPKRAITQQTPRITQLVLSIPRLVLSRIALLVLVPVLSVIACFLVGSTHKDAMHDQPMMWDSDDESESMNDKLTPPPGESLDVASAPADAPSPTVEFSNGVDAKPLNDMNDKVAPPPGKTFDVESAPADAPFPTVKPSMEIDGIPFTNDPKESTGSSQDGGI